jgi:hypothetical protein
MSDSKSSAAAAPFPVGMVRRGLSIGGVGLVAVNLVLMLTGAASAGTLPSAALWGGAAVCFLGAFVAFMLEPNKPSPDPAKTTKPASAAADSDAPGAGAARARGPRARTNRAPRSRRARRTAIPRRRLPRLPSFAVATRFACCAAAPRPSRALWSRSC